MVDFVFDKKQKLLKTEKQKGFAGSLPRNNTNNRKLVSRPGSGFPKTFNGNNRNGKTNNSNQEGDGDSDRESLRNLPPYEQRAFPFKQQFAVRSSDQLQKGVVSRSLNPSRPSTAKLIPKLTISRPASSKTMQIERGGSLNRPGSAMNSGGQYSAGFGKNVRPIQKISAPPGLSRPLSASTQNLPFRPIQKGLGARRPENNTLKKIRRENKPGEEEPTENIYDWVESNSSEDGETSKRIQANQRDFLKGVQKEAEASLKKLQQEELEVKERIAKLREEAEREEKRKADAILEQKQMNLSKKQTEQQQQQGDQQSGRISEDIPEDDNILTEEEMQRKRALSMEKQKEKAQQQLELKQKLDEETKEKERIAKELARAMQEQKDKEKIENENLKLKQEREELLQQIQQLQQQSQIQQQQQSQIQLQQQSVEKVISAQSQVSKQQKQLEKEEEQKQSEKQLDKNKNVVEIKNNKKQEENVTSPVKNNTIHDATDVVEDKELQNYLSGVVNAFLENMYLRAVVSNDYLLQLEKSSLDGYLGLMNQEKERKKDIPFIQLNETNGKHVDDTVKEDTDQDSSSPSSISEKSGSEESESEVVKDNANDNSKKILNSQQNQNGITNEDKNGTQKPIYTDNKEEKMILNAQKENDTKNDDDSQPNSADKETLLDKWSMEVQGKSLQLSLFRKQRKRIRICYLLKLQSQKDQQTSEVLYSRTIPACIAINLLKHISPSSKVTFTPLLYVNQEEKNIFDNLFSTDVTSLNCLFEFPKLSIGSKINLDIEFTLLGQSIAAKFVQDYIRNGFLNVFSRKEKIVNVGSQNAIKTSLVITLQQNPSFKKLSSYRVIDDSRKMQCNFEKQLFEILLQQKQNKTFSFLEYVKNNNNTRTNSQLIYILETILGFFYEILIDCFMSLNPPFFVKFNIDLQKKLITVKDKKTVAKPQVSVTAANMVIFKETKLYNVDRKLTECCIQVAYRQGEQPSLIFSAIGQNVKELAVAILRKITDKTEIIDFAKSIMRRLYIADESIKVADEKQLMAAQKLQKFHKMETVVKSQNFQLRINDEHGDINFIQGECHLIRRIGQYSVQLFKYEFADEDELTEGKLLHQQTIQIGIIDKAHKQSILQNFQSLVNTNITLENELLQFEDPNIFTDHAELIIHRMIFN